MRDVTCLSIRSAFVCGALLAACSAAAALAVERPNVVLLITDDQGYGDLACHGNSMIRTPNLDKLHAQSTRLTDFHVDPTCSPTRSALMSGRYSTRTGVWHTIAGRSMMRTEETTLAEVLSAAGYKTGIFGKWHLGDNYPLRPQDQGFSEVFIHGGGGVGQTPDYWGNDYFDDTYFHNGKPTQVRGYCTDVWFDRALRFVEANRQQPFFVYLPTNAPHGPYFVADEYKRPYLEQGVPESMAAFYGMITNIDENVGRLMQRLDELKLADNTILIFMTDNGTAAGVPRSGGGRQRKAAASESSWPGFAAGMRGSKGSEYDGGHRVPFFLRWPGHVPAGRDVDVLAAHIDVLPTLVELTGVRHGSDNALDGTSLAALITGDKAQPAAWPERTLLVHSQRLEVPEKWRKCAVMTERWRLVNGVELYDIQADPAQQHNVADEHSDIVAQLRGEYERWWTSLSEGFDETVPIVLGADAANPTLLTCHDWHTLQAMVPYSHAAVARDPLDNGWWSVEVERAGRYEITLRQRPEHMAHPLDATKARLRIGPLDTEQAVPPGASSVSFEVELPAGQAQLQTWLETENQSRGAYYVQVERK